MKTITLSELLKKMYTNEVANIKLINRELERQFFSIPGNAPLIEIMQGASFEDNFNHYKKEIKNASKEEIEQIFMLLKEYFLFSYGHDMMFKKKLEADLFTSAPIDDFLYPKLERAVREKYNDISIMRENPNFKRNIDGISEILKEHFDAQSLLYALYWNDFQFPRGWEKISEGNSQNIIDILNKSGITIGEFLHALIDDKCKIIKEILNEIADPVLRKQFLEELEEFRLEKHKETNEFAHVDLPATFFLDHTIMDFINMEKPSSLLIEDKPKVAQKLYIPNKD